MRIVFNFEFRCNMKCSWCYIPFHGSLPEERKCALALDIICRNSVVKAITFGGGDPFLYPFFPRLAHIAKSSGLFTHVDTNGIGLRSSDPEFSRLLKTIDLLGFPLDAHVAHVHDDMRDMTGHFEATKEKLHWARRIGFNLKINTVLTKKNSQCIDSMMPLVSSFQPCFWSIYQYWPLSLGGSVRLTHFLDRQDFHLAVSNVPERLWTGTIVEKHPIPSRLRAYPIVSHEGDVYVHSRAGDNFERVGSIFDGDTLQRALNQCVACSYIDQRYSRVL